MKKTIISSAVLMAIASPVLAAQWEAPALEFNGSNNDEMNETYTAFVYNEAGLSSGLSELKEGETGYVTSPDLTNGGSVNYGGAPVFLQANTANQTVTNNGKIWVIGNNESGAWVAEGMGTTSATGTRLVNNGTIFVDGKNAASAVSRIKGMSVIDGEVINQGDIVVTGNGVGMIDNSPMSSDPARKLINNGTISVIDSGVGIYFRKEASGISVENAKDITVSGSSAIGVLISNDKDEAGQGKTFTNTGRISATEGGVAIADNSTGTIINLSSANSNIDGDVLANATTTFNFTDNTDTLQLAANPLTPEDTAAKAGAIVTTNSKVTVELGSGAESLAIGTLSTAADSSTTFSLARMGSEADKVLTVGTVSGEGALKIQYTGTVSDEIVAGAQTEDLFNGISLGGYDLQQVSVSEGSWGDAVIYSLNADGSVNAEILGTNSLLSSATDLALMNGLVWRSQLSNLSDRMGTLRTMPEAAGLWVRYNNGRLEGRGIEHDYNVIELGVDTPVSNNFLFGVSFDYTIGDTDLNAGSADNDTYTIGMYGSYLADNGAFIDMMAKIGRIDSEYDLNNGISEKGDYMMTGAIVGVEAGHRFDINSFFVEPQVQLTYSWLRASDYTTNVRSVAFDTVESLVARVGVMGGVKFAENRGAAYLKASYNHDFLGDVDASFTDGAHTRFLSDELDDNWGDVSLGASYSITKSLNAFVDVGTGFGGDIDQKWRVNVGGKYVF